jgi:hypothetical protein
MFGEWTDRLPQLITKYQPCRKKAKTSRLLIGLEQVTRPKSCKLYDDDDDDDFSF